MSSYNLTCTLLVFLLFGNHVFGVNSRNKRCIVVQKQSGTHGDSSEGGDGDDDRSPQPRDPRPDRRRTLDPLENLQRDVEDLSPNLLKYQILPTKRYMGDVRRFKNRFYKTN